MGVSEGRREGFSREFVSTRFFWEERGEWGVSAKLNTRRRKDREIEGGKGRKKEGGQAERARSCSRTGVPEGLGSFHFLVRGLEGEGRFVLCHDDGVANG